MKNEYLVYVTGNDAIGYNFMQNCVEIASKGAVLQGGKVPCLRFPFSAWFTISTEEMLEDKPGFKFQVVQEAFSKEQLDEMDWDTLKATVKKKYGLTGRDRNLLITQYLKASGQVE